MALANLPRFEWRGVPFAAWLYRMAANKLADYWRRQRREAQDPLPDVPDEHEHEELQRRVSLFQLVERLPDLQRRVIETRFVEDKSVRDVAAALDRSENAVKQLQPPTCGTTRPPNFKARLRARLEKRQTMFTAELANIREGFTTVTPYVWVADRGLSDFLIRVFDAVETRVAEGGRHGTHRELRIGNSMLMLGEGAAGDLTPGAFCLYVADPDVVYEQAIAAGVKALSRRLWTSPPAIEWRSSMMRSAISGTSRARLLPSDFIHRASGNAPCARPHR